MKILIPGSFDPFHNGHLWLVEEVIRTHEDSEITIAITHNVDKKSQLPDNIKLKIIRESVPDWIKVEIVPNNQLLAYWAKSRGFERIMKGIRNEVDNVYEKSIEEINENLTGITTNIYTCPCYWRHISSSMIRHLTHYQDHHVILKKYLPPKAYKVYTDYVWGESLREIFNTIPYVACRIDLIESVIEKYCEPHRSYHNLNHILDCISKIPLVNGFISKQMLLSVIYHDVIYDCEPTDVDKSIEFFVKQTKCCLDDDLIGGVSSLIKATDYTINPSKDESIIRDIDWSVLGSIPEIFDDYDTSIRQEYKKFSDEVYTRERLKFVDMVLAKDKIFISGYFDHLEEQARINLSNLSKKLKG